MSTEMHGPAPEWLTPEELAEARGELEVERVERAIRWERVRRKVRYMLGYIRGCPIYMGDVKFYEARGVDILLDALEELERLEEEA